MAIQKLDTDEIDALLGELPAWTVVDGKLRREWRKVKVKGHADEVLEAVKDL